VLKSVGSNSCRT